MSSAVFPEYDSLDGLEKLKLRQLDLEYNKFIKSLDSISVEEIDDIRTSYLKAVGKTEDTLEIFDKQILKLLEGKLSGNEKLTNALLDFSSKTTKFAKGLKKAIPYIDALFTFIDFIDSIENINSVYKSQGIEAAKKAAVTELTRFAMENAVVWGSGNLSAYILGIDIASGPVGTVAAIAAVGVVTAFTFVAVNEIMTNDEFINNFWKPLDGNNLSVSISISQVPENSGYVEKIEDEWGINYWQDNDFANMIYGYGGSDEIHGAGGSDLIYGGNDKDYIFGGTGDDHLYGGNGENEIYGRHGNDVIYDGDDGSYIEGSFGNDRIFAGGGNDVIDPGEGDDYIQDDHGDDTIIFKAGYGTDTISDAAGYNTIALSGLHWRFSLRRKR